MKYFTYFIVSFLFVNTPNLHSDWVFDNYIGVNSKKSKVIKHKRDYCTLDKKGSVLYFTQMSNNNVDTIVIDSNYSDYLLGFDLNTDNLIFNSFKYVFSYDFKNKTIKKMSNKDKPFRDIELTDSGVVTYSADLSNVSCNNKTKALVQTINTKEEIQKIYSFPEPIGIDLSNFSPCKPIALFNNLIAIHDISTYSVKFYDLDYNYDDSIVYKPSNWKQYEGEIPHYECNPEIMDHIEKCWTIIDNYSRINLINTLNDSTLLITWSTLDKTSKERKFLYYHDKWVKTNNKWEFEKDSFLNNSQATEEFNLNKININADYTIKHGYLYIIKPYPLELVKKYFGKSFKEFENEMNEFYIDNELQYTCFIYKYVP